MPEHGHFRLWRRSFLTSRNIPTVDPTAWSILALLAAGDPPNTDTLIRAKEWIRRNLNSNGGWGPRKGLSSRVNTTFLACRCLAKLEQHYFKNNAVEFKDTLQWLLQCQNADGGWGPTPGDPSTAVHTAFALFTLYLLNMDHKTREVRKGVEYLYKTWNSKTMWEHTQTFEQYELPQADIAWTRISMNYFATPWIITSLLTIQESTFKEQIFLSIKWLIHTQNKDGSWTIDKVLRNRIWAVHDATLALTTFVSKAVSAETIDQIIRVDDTLILTQSLTVKRLFQVTTMVGIGILLIGCIIGVIMATTTSLNIFFTPWIQKYWAWMLLGAYVLSSFVLIKLKLISWKETFLGLLIPAILVIIQLFLKPW